jgi:hypothetical protein
VLKRYDTSLSFLRATISNENIHHPQSWSIFTLLEALEAR